ncbi:MAG: hypothetical protein QHH26_08445 [Armatimonadota bacterium]|nr:hypothetical protein [Armatimonadota bacterium]
MKKAEFGALKGQALFGLAFYFMAVVGVHMLCLPLRIQPPAQISDVYPQFIAGAVLLLLGTGALAGWVVSPGGFRFLYVPFGMLIRKWPACFGERPIPKEHTAIWGRESWSLAVRFIISAAPFVWLTWLIMTIAIRTWQPK